MSDARYEDRYRSGGNTALLEAQRFFMGESEVQKSLKRIAAKLDEMAIPYVVVGGMALVAHGYARTTVDVDLLVTPASLARIHAELDGLGYLPPFQGSKQLRDTTTNVRIEFLVTGQFPGDGKPQPVSFPDPIDVATVIDGIRYLRLPTLIELKLASAMSNPGRVKDFGDVQELIRVLSLKADFADQLNAFVRPKFLELLRGIEGDLRSDMA